MLFSIEFVSVGNTEILLIDSTQKSVSEIFFLNAQRKYGKHKPKF